MAAPFVAPPSRDAISVDDWLQAHGIAHWDHDAACWTRNTGLAGATAWENDCRCDHAITLARETPVDLLVCERSRETTVPAVPWIQHAVVYEADHGHLLIVLDVPIAAASDSEGVVWTVGNVRLAVGARGPEVDITDQGVASGHGCPAALTAAHHENMNDVARAFASVCASVGPWLWTGSRLVRGPRR